MKTVKTLTLKRLVVPREKTMFTTGIAGRLGAVVGNGIVALGLVIGVIEGWSVHESIYFAFVSGLTIGYGDLAPKALLTRLLAILIGICGVLLTALVAAIAVRALTAASEDDEATLKRKSTA